MPEHIDFLRMTADEFRAWVARVNDAQAIRRANLLLLAFALDHDPRHVLDAERILRRSGAAIPAHLRREAKAARRATRKPRGRGRPAQTLRDLRMLLRARSLPEYRKGDADEDPKPLTEITHDGRAFHVADHDFDQVMPLLRGRRFTREFARDLRALPRYRPARRDSAGFPVEWRSPLLAVLGSEFGIGGRDTVRDAVKAIRARLAAL